MGKWIGSNAVIGNDVKLHDCLIGEDCSIGSKAAIWGLEKYGFMAVCVNAQVGEDSLVKGYVARGACMGAESILHGYLDGKLADHCEFSSHSENLTVDIDDNSLVNIQEDEHQRENQGFLKTGHDVELYLERVFGKVTIGNSVKLGCKPAENSLEKLQRCDLHDAALPDEVEVLGTYAFDEKTFVFYHDGHTLLVDDDDNVQINPGQTHTLPKASLKLLKAVTLHAHALHVKRLTAIRQANGRLRALRTKVDRFVKEVNHDLQGAD